MSWFSWLWPDRSKQPTHRRDPITSLVMPVRTEPAVAHVAPQGEDRLALSWLLGCADLADTPMSPVERSALDAISKTLALPEVPDNLLPRAAALIPQLIALVRQTSLPTPVIAERVRKDAVLAAEVMRLASSSYYRAQGDVTNLEQAIALIGLQGLQTVIARVLLKPIYQAAPGPLSSQAGSRMWEHSEALARHTAILAEPAGQPVFDGYLAGMLRDTGWIIAFGIIDRANLKLAVPPSQAFGSALAEQVHRMFGLAAQRWEITPGFAALAQDVRRNGLAASSHPLARMLKQGQQLCLAELAPETRFGAVAQHSERADG